MQAAMVAVTPLAITRAPAIAITLPQVRRHQPHPAVTAHAPAGKLKMPAIMDAVTQRAIQHAPDFATITPVSEAARVPVVKYKMQAQPAAAIRSAMILVPAIAIITRVYTILH